MEPIKIVGLIGSQEICRCFIVPKRCLDVEDILAIVWRDYPHLKNKTARVYINGIPATRVQMGQTLYSNDE